MEVAVAFPGGDFVLEDLFVGDAAVEALGGKNAEFGLGEVEPGAMLWGVAPFEAARRAAWLRRPGRPGTATPCSGC